METKGTKQIEDQKVRLNKYRRIIKRVLTEYAAVPYAFGEIETETIFDQAKDRYLLVNVGWDRGGRIHGCLVHMDIINGKIWIQRDGTEDGMADDLERAGVPKEHIVLGFRAPDVRKYTEYAAA